MGLAVCGDLSLQLLQPSGTQEHKPPVAAKARRSLGVPLAAATEAVAPDACKSSSRRYWHSEAWQRESMQMAPACWSETEGDWKGGTHWKEKKK